MNECKQILCLTGTLRLSTPNAKRTVGRFNKLFPAPVPCWVFRRIDSRVLPGVIEVVAHHKLRDVYDLQNGDAVIIDILPPQASKDDLSDMRG